MLTCVLFVVVGGQLWSSVTSDIHMRERVYANCPSQVPIEECGFTYQTFVTGSTPNHVPAVLAFVVGGCAGLFGVILVRARSTPAMRSDLLTSS